MKSRTLLYSVLLMVILLSACKGDRPGPEKPGAAIPPAQEKSGQEEPKEKKDEPLDIDKLDIPERMKAAVKEGRIPMERVQQFLEMRRGGGGPGGGDAALVELSRVQQKEIHSSLVLNGIVEPQNTVEVYSRLSAHVKSIVKEEGQRVKKNDVLALLDDTEIQISYQQARIMLKQAELSLADQEENFRRSSELKANNLISDKDFQASQSALQSAKLEFENRRQNYNSLELQLGYTRIISPIDGFITRRLIEVGHKLNPNQHVYTVENFSPLLVRLNVPTADVVNISPGMKAEITSDVLRGNVFPGQVKLVNPRVEVQSGTVRVTVEVDDPSGSLRPGMFTEVRILVRANPDALVIPRRSVLYRQNKSWVFTFTNFSAQQREISTGIIDGDNIEVISGLERGEFVIISGMENLKDGQQVRPANEGRPGGNQGSGERQRPADENR